MHAHRVEWDRGVVSEFEQEIRFLRGMRHQYVYIYPLI